MKKEMICVCRIEGDTLYYGKSYEVSELGKAKREAARLMTRGADYRIVLCAVNEDGSVAELGGYWEKYFGNTWRYNSTPKFQEAYNGMEVEINLKTTTNINGTIEFGKVIDPENLVVELESGEIVYYNNNPWEKDNTDKRYFSFINDIYPAPQRYYIEYEHHQNKDNHIFDRKSDSKGFNSYKAAKKEYDEKKAGYENMVGKAGSKNEVVDTFPGFEYREWNDGVLQVDNYRLVGNNWSYKRF